MSQAGLSQSTIAVASLHGRDAYRLMTSIIVPRPIGWISTVGADGTLNLAPYSFFNGAGSNPPTLLFSVGRRAGNEKDTLRNVRETGEFVVNIVGRELIEQMNVTSGDWDYGISELHQAGLTAAESIDVRPPRVLEAPAAMECRATQIVPINDTSYTLVIGHVLRFHLRAGLLRPNGLVDPLKLDPVCRLGGDEYAALGTILTLPRPSA